MRQDCEQNSVKIANNEICIRDYLFCNYLNNDFKVHTAYIAEVKRSFGLPMYDAPNAVETLKSPRKHPTPVHVDAIKDALTHFEII